MQKTIQFDEGASLAAHGLNLYVQISSFGSGTRYPRIISTSTNFRSNVIGVCSISLNLSEIVCLKLV